MRNASAISLIILASAILAAASAQVSYSPYNAPTALTPYPVIDHTTCAGPKLGSVPIEGQTWKAQTCVPLTARDLIRVDLPGEHIRSMATLHVRATRNGQPIGPDLAASSITSGSTFIFAKAVILAPGDLYSLVLSSSRGFYYWDCSDSSSCYPNPLGRPLTSLDAREHWTFDMADFFFTSIALPDTPRGTPAPSVEPTTAPPGPALRHPAVFVVSFPMSAPAHDPHIWTEELIRLLTEASMYHPPDILNEPDYDFSNPRTVQTICMDWQMDGSAQVGQVSCGAWGCTRLGYHVWWMQNMPGMDNTNHDRNGDLQPSWWSYPETFQAPIEGIRLEFMGIAPSGMSWG